MLPVGIGRALLLHHPSHGDGRLCSLARTACPLPQSCLRGLWLLPDGQRHGIGTEHGLRVVAECREAGRVAALDVVLHAAGQTGNVLVGREPGVAVVIRRHRPLHSHNGPYAPARDGGVAQRHVLVPSHQLCHPWHVGLGQVVQVHHHVGSVGPDVCLGASAVQVGPGVECRQLLLEGLRPVGTRRFGGGIALSSCLGLAGPAGTVLGGRGRQLVAAYFGRHRFPRRLLGQLVGKGREEMNCIHFYII